MWQRFLTAALLECVSEEKLPVFPSLLHLDKVSWTVATGYPVAMLTTFHAF